MTGKSAFWTMFGGSMGCFSAIVAMFVIWIAWSILALSGITYVGTQVNDSHEIDTETFDSRSIDEEVGDALKGNGQKASIPNVKPRSTPVSPRTRIKPEPTPNR